MLIGLECIELALIPSDGGVGTRITNFSTFVQLLGEPKAESWCTLMGLRAMYLARTLATSTKVMIPDLNISVLKY